MALTPEMEEELESYYSNRTRSRAMPQHSNIVTPEVVTGLEASAGGNFTAQDLVDYENYQATGQLPETSPSPVEVQSPQHQPIPDGGRGPVVEQDAGFQTVLDKIISGSQQTEPMPPNELVAQPQPETGGPAPVESAPSSTEEELRQHYRNSGQIESAAYTPEGELGQGWGPSPEYPTQNSLDTLDTGRLQGQVERQRGEVERLTGETAPEKDTNPGFLNKLLDNLSRFNYAAAGGVSAAQEAGEANPDQGFMDLGTVDDFFRGAKEGFMLDRKDTFADVLDNAGVENNVVKGIGGFVLDVALDPTTYVGMPVVKAATKGASVTAGIRAAETAAKSPAVREAAEKTVEARLSKQLLDNLKSKKLNELPSETAREKLVQREIDKTVGATLDGAQVKALTPGKVQFTFAGKKLGESEKLYEIVTTAFTPLAKLPAAQSLNRLFRPAAELGELHKSSRYWENISANQFEDHTQFFNDQWKHLSKQDAELAAFVAEGTKTTDNPEILALVAAAKKMNDEWFDQEEGLGILAEGTVKRENYAYHFYKKDGKESLAYKQKHKRGKADFAHERDYATFDEAIRDGMKPELDLRTITTHRAAKHWKEVSYHGMMEDAMNNMGLKTGSKAAASVAKALKDKGIELEKVTHNGVEALFPAPVAESIRTLQNIRADDKALSQLMRNFDKFHQSAKFGMTVINPGHHLRNLTGNLFQAYQAGMRNPDNVRHSMIGVLGARFAKTGSDNPAVQKALNTKTKVGDGMSSIDELYQLYKATGTKSGFVQAELAHGARGKFTKGIRSVASDREDVPRFAQFIDQLKKDKPKNWSRMTFEEKRVFATNASDQVQKFQLDYGDLTHFEKKVMRRVMMFYTFARKNIPLQLEMMATRPGKIVNTRKAGTAVEQMLGIEDNEDSLLNRIPEWMLQDQTAQLGGLDENGERSLVQQMLGTDDPVFTNMMLPTADLNRIPTSLNPADIGKNVLNQFVSETSLPLKMGTEIAYGTQAYSGAPRPTGAQYASQQLPIANLIRKMIDPEGSTNENIGQDWVNWMTGAGIQTATQQRQQSELRRQQDPIQQLISDARRDSRDTWNEERREARGG